MRTAQAIIFADVVWPDGVELPEQVMADLCPVLALGIAGYLQSLEDEYPDLVSGKVSVSWGTPPSRDPHRAIAAGVAEVGLIGRAAGYKIGPMPQSTAEIEEAFVRLHEHWYGHGPSAAQAWISEGVVVVVLEETFTPADMAMIERGDVKGLRSRRRRFQQAAKDEFVSIITQATGRQVRAFISDTDLDQQIAIEVFVLGEVMESMTQFEERSIERHDDPPR